MQTRDSWFKTISYKFLVYEVMKEKNVDMFPSQESLNGHTTRQLCLCHRNGSNIMWSNLKEAEEL